MTDDQPLPAREQLRQARIELQARMAEIEVRFKARQEFEEREKGLRSGRIEPANPGEQTIADQGKADREAKAARKVRRAARRARKEAREAARDDTRPTVAPVDLDALDVGSLGRTDKNARGPVGPQSESDRSNRDFGSGIEPSPPARHALVRDQ